MRIREESLVNLGKALGVDETLTSIPQAAKAMYSKWGFIVPQMGTTEVLTDVVGFAQTDHNKTMDEFAKFCKMAKSDKKELLDRQPELVAHYCKVRLTTKKGEKRPHGKYVRLSDSVLKQVEKYTEATNGTLSSAMYDLIKVGLANV